MSGFTDEAVKKLSKDNLIRIIQEQKCKGDRNIEKMGNLTNEVRKRNQSFQNLDVYVAIVKKLALLYPKVS